jgi:hypothetical protein
MLRIKDLDFKIESAILDAYVDKNNMKLKWGVEIKAMPGDGELAHWAPKVTAETFIENVPGQLTHWFDLAGTQIKWDEPYGSDDEPYALFYVFEHEPIHSSYIEINKNNDSLYLYWNGKADVNWGPDYGQSLDLRIETELFFKGIWFGRESENNSLPILSKFFNPDLFQFVQTEHGVSLFRPK